MNISQVTLIRADDIGNDILYIEGTITGQIDTNGKLIVFKATGWVSAIKNFYDKSSYDAGNNLKNGSIPREMTIPEKQAYCKQLLIDHNKEDIPFSTISISLGII